MSPVRQGRNAVTAVVIRWESPPPTHRNRWANTALELQAEPGRWALVAEDEPREYANDTVARCLRRAGCEVVTREKAGVMSVWARWGEHGDR